MSHGPLDREKFRNLYGLVGNPFAPGGAYPLGSMDEKKFALAFGGRDDAKNIISQVLEGLSSGHSPAVLAIYGPYGYGKTHALRYIFWKARDEYADILPIYVKSITSPSGLEVYRSVVNELLSVYGVEFLIPAFKKALEKLQVNPKVRETLRNLFSQFERVLPEIISGNQMAIKWLLGNNLKTEEQFSIGVFENITEETAARALSALAFLIYQGVQKRMLILLDELDEAISRAPKEDVAKFYAFLRNLIDHGYGYFTLVLALPPIAMSGDRSIGTLYPALESRMSGGGFKISLTRFDEEEALKVVASYLKQFRAASARGVVSDIYPFTRDAIRKAVELTEGYPREFIALLYDVLNEGVRRNRSEIDADFVETVYMQRREMQEQPLEQRRELPVPITRDYVRKLRKEELVRNYREKVIRYLRDAGGQMAWSKLRDYLRLSDSDMELLIEGLSNVVGVRKIGKRGRRIYLKV